MGWNIRVCQECGHEEIHYNSCRNRNCPNCQAILKEVWIDARKSEVIDTSYFHVVFTVPVELNPLIYANQKLLYSILHRCSSETRLELFADRKYLGATPGIIQVLHTWGQNLNFHPHIHCIVTGGKFLAYLQMMYADRQLSFSDSCESLRNSYAWSTFRDTLYRKDWCPYIKETFNGFGNPVCFRKRGDFLRKRL